MHASRGLVVTVWARCPNPLLDMLEGSQVAGSYPTDHQSSRASSESIMKHWPCFLQQLRGWPFPSLPAHIPVLPLHLHVTVLGSRSWVGGATGLPGPSALWCLSAWARDPHVGYASAFVRIIQPGRTVALVKNQKGRMLWFLLSLPPLSSCPPSPSRRHLPTLSTHACRPPNHLRKRL